MTDDRHLSDVERALAWALGKLPREGHYGSAAHPTGRPFEYVPAICPGCALAVLSAERRRLRETLCRPDTRPGIPSAVEWLRAEQARTRHERERLGPEGKQARQPLADRFAAKLRPAKTR